MCGIISVRTLRTTEHVVGECQLQAFRGGIDVVHGAMPEALDLLRDLNAHLWPSSHDRWSFCLSIKVFFFFSGQVLPALRLRRPTGGVLVHGWLLQFRPPHRPRPRWPGRPAGPGARRLLAQMLGPPSVCTSHTHTHHNTSRTTLLPNLVLNVGFTNWQ